MMTLLIEAALAWEERGLNDLNGLMAIWFWLGNVWLVPLPTF